MLKASLPEVNHNTNQESVCAVLEMDVSEVRGFSLLQRDFEEMKDMTLGPLGGRTIARSTWKEW